MQSRKSKPKTNAAEKALRVAIAEETAHLNTVIGQKDAEISRLHGVIAQIGRIVGGVAPARAVVAAPPPARQPEVMEEVDPPAPTTELADGDNMGEGRWA